MAVVIIGVSLHTIELRMAEFGLTVTATYTTISAEQLDTTILEITRRLHRRSLRLPTTRKWAQSGYLCSTPSTAHAKADAGISWS